MYHSQPQAEDSVDPRVSQLVEEYAHQLGEGGDVDLDAFIAEHNEWAEQLRPALRALRSMLQLAEKQGAIRSQLVLGDFRLIRLIGCGGMGEVFEAEQLSLQRRVALKLLPRLHPSDYQTASLERFRNEAQVAAALDHPHIVPVYEFDCVDDRHYIAMKLIDGWTWRAQIDGSKPRVENECGRGLESTFSHTFEPPDWRVPAVHIRDVAYGLAHAHERGVIHRDIKPSNLLLDKSNKTWITDFGLARFVGSETLTMTGELLGTLRYMSPEQASGGRLAVDHRCDIYSLGVTLYEMVTGERAITAESRSEQLLQVTTGAIEPPSRLNARLPRDLETVIQKMLAREAVDRYASAELVAEDLQRVLDGRTIAAQRMTSSQRITRWSRSHATLLFTSIMAMLLLLAIMSGLWLRERWWNGWAAQQNHELSRRTTLAEQATQSAQLEAQRAEMAERAAQLNLLQTKMALARAASHASAPGGQHQALQLINEAADLARSQGSLAAFSFGLRNLAITALSRCDIVQQYRLPLTSGDQPNFDVTSDFSTIVSVEPDAAGKFQAIARDFSPDMRERWRIELPAADRTYHTSYAVKFSLNDRYLAIGVRPARVMVWEIDTQRIVLDIPAVHSIENDFRFSHDSSRFAVATSSPPALEVYSLENGKRLTRIAGKINGVEFTADDQQIITQFERQVVGFDIKTAAERWRRTVPHGQFAYSLSTSEDGKYIAAGLTNSILVWDCEYNDRPATELRCTPSPVDRLSFQPGNSSVLVSMNWENTVKLWNVENGTLELTTGGSPACWSRDGSEIAIGYLQSVARHHLLPAQACRWLHMPAFENTAYQCDFSSDGQLLVTTSKAALQVRSAADGRELARIDEPHTTAIFHPARDAILASADGRGVFLWPLHSTERSLTIGPPNRLIPFKGPAYAAVTRDGSRIAASLSFSESVLLVDPVDLTSERIAPPHLRTFKMSPEGEWFAVGFLESLEIWDARTYQVLTRIPNDGLSVPSWSPDNRWLVLTSNAHTRIFSSGDWREVYRSVRGRVVYFEVGFNADSSLTAIPLDAGKSALVRLHDREVLAELESIEKPELRHAIALSPSGHRVACTYPQRGIQLWDIAAIRRELKVMGLDWDSRDLEVPTVPANLAIDRIQFDLSGFDLSDLDAKPPWRALLDSLPWQQFLQPH